MKISSELKTGIIALVALAAFIWGISYLKGENLLSSSRHFYAEYDNVQGLEPSGSVTINGLKVGFIDKVFFHPKKTGRIVVRFSLDNPYEFSKQSVARIYSPDFISGKSIKILPVFGGEMAKSGDTLRGNVEAGILGAINDQVAPLQTKIDAFLTSTNSVISKFDTIFDNKSQNNLKQAISGLNSTLSTFNAAGSSLNAMLAENGKLDSIFTNATTASANLSNLTDSLNNANLKATVLKLETTIENFNSILAKVNNGEGSIGKLLKDEGLYQNLEGATKEMEELLREFKLNPKRFVHFSLFGKKQKPFILQDSIN